MKRMAFMLVATSALLSGQAGGEVIDFESPTYTTTGGAGGTAQITGQDGWLNPVGGPEQAVIETTTVFNGSQSLRTSGDPDPTRYSTGSRTGVGGTDGSSVDWYARTSSTEIGTLLLFYFGTSTTDLSAAAVNVGIEKSRVNYRDGGTSLVSAANSIAADVWYHFTATLDFTNSQYDLAVESVGLVSGDAGFLDFSATGLGFRNAAETDATAVVVLSTTRDPEDYFVVDDISFNAVPEPGAMTLLGLGGLAILSSRKR